MNIYPITQLRGNVTIEQELIDYVGQCNWHTPEDLNSPLRVSNKLYLQPNVTGSRITEHNSVTELARIINPLLIKLQNLMPGCECIRALLVRLPPGARQDWHVDPRILHKLSHRLHVALITNTECVLEVNNHQQHFAVGEVWEFNNLLPHRASNSGKHARIHLITDWINSQQLSESHDCLEDIRQDIIDNVGTLYSSTRAKCLLQGGYHVI